MSRKITFSDRASLISALRTVGATGAQCFAIPPEEQRPALEVVRDWVSANTFRAFHNCATRPSVIFREWALGQLESADFPQTLADIYSREEYVEWHKGFCDSLATVWHQRAEKSMPWGPSRKLPDLLMKGILRNWRRPPWNNQWAVKLCWWVNVPLDSFVLTTIRSELKVRGTGGRTRYLIPASATMGWVSSQARYDLVQDAIRDVAREAGVPAIHFDFAWELAHR